MDIDLEECIERISNNGNLEDMHRLSEILEDTLEVLERENPQISKKYQMELYTMAYGKTLTRQMAEEIVSNMKPYRMRWTFEDTQQLQNQYGIDNIRNVDFFIVINSAYNDYRDLFGEDIENYIKFTIDFISDEDAKDGKVFTYFTTIPR